MKDLKKTSSRDASNIDRYFLDMGDVKKLTSDEEARLAGEIRNGSRRALEKLTTANLKFVVSIANQYANKGVETEDLINEGNIGLIKAAHKFDPSKGSRFAAYAAPYIKQCIEKAIERIAEPKEDKREGAPYVNKRHLSVNSPITAGNNRSLLDILGNGEFADDLADNTSNDKRFAAAFTRLNEREANVIKCLYGIGCPPLTYAETGAKYGFKRERVRQIKITALRKLKRK